MAMFDLFFSKHWATLKKLIFLKVINSDNSQGNLYVYDSSKAALGTTTRNKTRAYYPLGLSNCTLSFSASIIDESVKTDAEIYVSKILENGQIQENINNLFLSSSFGIYDRTITIGDKEEAVLYAGSNTLRSITSNLPKYNIFCYKQ